MRAELSSSRELSAKTVNYGQFEGDRNPEQIIRVWGTRKLNQEPKLDDFKARVRCEVISDPKAELAAELENLYRDEDTETTIARWLGYLLQVELSFTIVRFNRKID